MKLAKLNLNIAVRKKSLPDTIFKTLGFTYLNPHVYSDTVFFLGNFSKNLMLKQKIFFGLGATLSSFIFFFILGYMSKYLSNYLKTKKIWRSYKYINYYIYVFFNSLYFSKYY